MPDPEVFIRGTAAATPFGASVRENLDALFAGRTAFAEPRHFDAKGRLLGIDPDLDGGGESRIFRLLRKLRDAVDFPIPAGARLFAATTSGAIDLLEQGGDLDTSAACLDAAKRIFGLDDGEKPRTPAFKATRQGDLDMLVAIAPQADALGYNILFGSGPEKLYHSYMTFAPGETRVGALIQGREYCVRVDAFNESGITQGTCIKLK